MHLEGDGMVELPAELTLEINAQQPNVRGKADSSARRREPWEVLVGEGDRDQRLEDLPCLGTDDREAAALLGRVAQEDAVGRQELLQYVGVLRLGARRADEIEPALGKAEHSKLARN